MSRSSGLIVRPQDMRESSRRRKSLSGLVLKRSRRPRCSSPVEWVCISPPHAPGPASKNDEAGTAFGSQPSAIKKWGEGI
jgi:hypothetical protein